jgi:hypothetical protein
VGSSVVVVLVEDVVLVVGSPVVVVVGSTVVVVVGSPVVVVVGSKVVLVVELLVVVVVGSEVVVVVEVLVLVVVVSLDVVVVVVEPDAVVVVVVGPDTVVVVVVGPDTVVVVVVGPLTVVVVVVDPPDVVVVVVPDVVVVVVGGKGPPITKRSINVEHVPVDCTLIIVVLSGTKTVNIAGEAIKDLLTPVIKTTNEPDALDNKLKGPVLAPNPDNDILTENGMSNILYYTVVVVVVGTQTPVFVIVTEDPVGAAIDPVQAQIVTLDPLFTS